MNNKPLILDQQFYKIPPQNVEIEEAVLGALMLEGKSYFKIAHVIRDDTFYKDAHRIIFEAIKQLADKGSPVDLLTVTAELRKKEELDLCGGVHYLTQLTRPVASAANIVAWATALEEVAFKRRLIALAGEIMRGCYDPTGDVFEIYENHTRDLFKAAIQFSTQGTTLEERIKNTLVHIRNAKEKEGVVGVPSQINALDKCLGGFQKGEMIIVGARPGMGKTAFVIAACHGAAAKGITPLMFQLEMSEVQTGIRELAMYSKTFMEKMRTGDLTEGELAHIEASTFGMPKEVLVDHSPHLSLSILRAKIYKYIVEKKVGLIIIDYLQLMQLPRAERKDLSIEETTRAIKLIAKEYDIPIILLSQLNREVEKRANKKPQLSDLRESGAIEQDADVVLLLYYPYGYDKKAIDADTGASLENQLCIIVAKNRMGATKDVWIEWFAGTNTLRDKITENTF